MAPNRPSASRPDTRSRVLSFVRECVQRGTPPTVREVQRAMGFRAVQSAQQHLEALVKDGALVREQGQARGYRLPSTEHTAPLFVPLVGRVQAGALHAAIEHHEGHVPIEARPRLRPRKPDELFALRVRGDSMQNAAILDGDVVIVRRQPHAETGDIVVAQVDGEATVKRLKLRPGRVELWPENPDFEPIVLRPPAEPEILGKVLEVRRYLDGHRAPSSTLSSAPSRSSKGGAR
ncbi:MAG: transcriptional repressor LexA [Polyangiales bacterium]